VTWKLGTTLTLVAVLLTPVACTSGSFKDKSSSPATQQSSSSSSTSPAPSSAGQTATDPAATEVANRQAVEAAWRRFWQVDTQLMKIPAAELPARIGEVAIGATRAQMLRAVKGFRATHQAQYGHVINHPYWKASVGDKPNAVIYDCMDQSHFGSLYTTTGVKHTVGVAHDNARGALVKGADGVWRVRDIEYLLDQKC
jgi:hypothetical protein